MPVKRIEVLQHILDDAEQISPKAPEHTLAKWLKRGHDVDENLHGTYEAYDVLVGSEEIQESRVIRMAPRHHHKKIA